MSNELSPEITDLIERLRSPAPQDVFRLLDMAADELNSLSQYCRYLQVISDRSEERRRVAVDAIAMTLGRLNNPMLDTSMFDDVKHALVDAWHKST